MATPDDITKDIEYDLRVVYEKLGITPETMLTIQKKIVEGDAKDSDRLRAIELYVKWLGLSAPESYKTEEVIKISGNDDLEDI